MRTPSTATRLLAVHAHPDDETLWTGLALASARRRGGAAHVLTCTLGEEGEVIPAELAHLEQAAGDPLGLHRREELRRAMRALGASHEVLGERTALGGWRDSGMAGSAAAEHPRALAAADPAAVASAIAEVVDRFAPDVVVTYDRHGGYGHPDHIAVHDATCRALSRPGSPPLYAVVTPQSWAEEDRVALAADLDPTLGWTVPGPTDPYPPSVVEDGLVDDVILAPELVPIQVGALREHATQVLVADGAYALSNLVAARLSGREGYARLDPHTGGLMAGGPTR